MALVNETDEFAFLATIFPELRSWIYYETDDHIPIEDIVKSHGKWVIYGSKEYVENLGNSLRPEIDGKTITGLKYSKWFTSVTPNSPYRSHALLVYCHDYNRDQVLSKLKSMGVEEPTWKYDRKTLLEQFSDPQNCWRYARISPEKFKRIVELIELDVDPKILAKIDAYHEALYDMADKCNELAEMAKAGTDEKALELKIREYFDSNFSFRKESI